MRVCTRGDETFLGGVQPQSLRAGVSSRPVRSPSTTRRDGGCFLQLVTFVGKRPDEDFVLRSCALRAAEVSSEDVSYTHGVRSGAVTRSVPSRVSRLPTCASDPQRNRIRDL